MSTTFDEREQAFERRSVQEEDMRFRARVRRNLLLGGWACERIRIRNDAAARLIEAFTDLGIVTADEPLLAMLQAELKTAGVEETLPSLRKEMEQRAALVWAEQRVGVALDQGSSV